MGEHITSTRTRLAHHGLHVWHLAVELVRLVRSQPISDAELRDQATRAAKSAALNIAEAAGLCGAASKRHFRIARGSVIELAAAYELAEALGEPVRLAAVLQRCTQLAAMLTALCR